jgi:hypothetical protein
MNLHQARILAAHPVHATVFGKEGHVRFTGRAKGARCSAAR